MVGWIALGTTKRGCATLRRYVIPSDTETSPISKASHFSHARFLSFAAISVLLLIPCFWHQRVEAGDLGSHVYNAWLAQLITKGQAPGLYVVQRWNNVLFDFLLLKLDNWFGLFAAEKIAVSLSVLIFFWGTFALISAVAQRPPWFLLPCIAMLAYGWTFNVGFFNYYLSLGLGFFVIAIFWRRRGRESLWALPFAALVFVAHPQGFGLLLGCVAYIALWRILPDSWKLTLPIAAGLLIIAVRLYCSRHYEMFTVWNSFGPGIYNGADQIVLYSGRYLLLSRVAQLFGVSCFAFEYLRRRRAHQSWQSFRLPLELYGILILATYVLPDVLRLPLYSGWIGSAALRLTTSSAALGLCVLGILQPRKWHLVGFGAIAALFFVFLYQDTGVLNRMEQQIERLVSTLPPQQRVLATVWAPPDSRVPYIVHMVDRACIAKCFSYENYEPSSGEFRVRVEDDSPIVSPDSDEREQMEAGEYVVKPADLPIWQIYQCDGSDLTKLCLRQLQAGEENGRLGYHPPR